ncbi:MAG: hypothetical protein V7754_08655 [Halioglobus sp.]
MPVILHVGGAKCGSTALQTALSRQPMPQSSQYSQLRYAFISRQWQVGLVQPSADTGRSNIQSVGFIDEHLPSEAEVGVMAADLNNLCQQGITPILSAEGWLNSAGFLQSGLIEKIEDEVQVFVWVRPQVEWINSAWWQWGAWGGGHGVRVAHWVNNNLHRCQWGDRLALWQQRFDVQFHVRLLDKDVVEDFSQQCQISGLESDNVNAALDGTMLRFLQNHRELRSSAHDTALTSAVARNLPRGSARTPWVIPEKQVARILRNCAAGNRQMMALLGAPQRRRMQEDSRWWLPEAYASRQPESWQGQSQTVEEVSTLAASALKGILTLDSENVKLKKQLLNLQKRHAALKDK